MKLTSTLIAAIAATASAKTLVELKPAAELEVLKDLQTEEGVGRIISSPVMQGGCGGVISSPVMNGGGGGVISSPVMQGGWGGVISSPVMG